MTPEYIDKVIETARHADKNNPIHNTLKQVTVMQPEAVRDRIRNYLENTITDYKDRPMGFNGESLDNMTACFLDNSDVFNRFEKAAVSLMFDVKAHRIFADYRAGIAELAGKDGKQYFSAGENTATVPGL